MNSISNRLLVGVGRLLLVAFIVAGFGGRAFADVPEGIKIGIKVSQAEFSVKEALMLKVSYTNTTDQPIQMLKWGTALEGRINEDFLSVIFDGEELAYSGRHIKRAPAGADDFVTINAAQTLSRSVDLLTGYDIDLKGQYEILPRGLSSPTLKKVVPISFMLLADRPISFKRTPAVNSCPDGVNGLPNNRFALIDPAVSAAESIARRARDDMRNTPISQRPNARRYQEWFGIYSEARWNTVQSHFDLIYDAVRLQTLVFVCEDNESFFAAVNPGNPYVIFLGRAFWAARRTGTDSKAGTIIHELSHFNVLGGTDDNAYGQPLARSLAINNPQSAINNADSHEYFAENTPFLAMPQPGVEPELAPDLVAKPISVSRRNLNVKDSVVVVGGLQNIGDADSTITQLSFKISNDARITAADPQIAQRSAPALLSGSDFNFEVGLTMPDEEGQYWLGVCAAPVSGEVETSNNCSAAVPVLIQRQAIITSILLLLLSDDD